MEPMLSLTVKPQSVELVIGALRQLPHAQVHELVVDLWGQYVKQLDALGLVRVEKTADDEPEAEAESEPDSEGGNAD